MAGAREMVEQGGDHLFEPHRDGAAARTDRQHVLFQVGNVTGIGTLCREGGHKYTLQPREAGSVILHAGERRIAPDITVQQCTHQAGCSGRSGTDMINYSFPHIV